MIAPDTDPITLGDFETDMLRVKARVIDTDILIELDREEETDTLATELREALVLCELDGVLVIVAIDDANCVVDTDTLAVADIVLLFDEDTLILPIGERVNEGLALNVRLIVFDKE